MPGDSLPQASDIELKMMEQEQNETSMEEMSRIIFNKLRQEFCKNNPIFKDIDSFHNTLNNNCNNYKKNEMILFKNINYLNSTKQIYDNCLWHIAQNMIDPSLSQIDPSLSQQQQNPNRANRELFFKGFKEKINNLISIPITHKAFNGHELIYRSKEFNFNRRKRLYIYKNMNQNKCGTPIRPPSKDNCFSDGDDNVDDEDYDNNDKDNDNDQEHPSMQLNEWISCFEKIKKKQS